VIITGGTPVKQLCWSELWMRFSARTLTAAPNPVVDAQEVSQPCAQFTVAPGIAALMPSSAEITLPCSRSLTCIILSPIALAGMRTYKPRGEGLNAYPPTHSTRDH
jgi:hypothetical protein